MAGRTVADIIETLLPLLVSAKLTFLSHISIYLSLSKQVPVTMICAHIVDTIDLERLSAHSHIAWLRLQITSGLCGDMSNEQQLKYQPGTV